MDVSIILVSYNTRELLAESLASVKAVSTELAYEVLVVDNGSADGSPEMVRRDFSGVRLIVNANNRGFAAANNQAMALARGRYFLLLNSDALLGTGSLEGMVRYLDSHARVGIVGGKLVNSDGSFQGSYADFPSLTGELLLATRLAPLVYWPSFPSYPEERSQQERLVDWVSGAFMMVRRQASDSVGLMDESYFMYTEETDWCFRMRQSGWAVAYLPSAQVVHLVGQSARRAPERRRVQVYRSKWLFFRKHRGVVVASAFRLLLRGVSAIKLAGWFVRAIAWRGTQRTKAREQVRSYTMLLAEL